MMLGATKVVRVVCPRCGVEPQGVAASRIVENTQAHVVTCLRLACGHAWHRTIRNIGGLFPGNPRNATLAPCDCPPPGSTRT
ncbi:MAG: hypothetical protein ACREMQ_12635 [Longimicrobiales bacterium]